MKKLFLVEIEYEEISTDGDVVYDYSLENGIETWMNGFIDTKSIKNNFKVNVQEASD